MKLDDRAYPHIVWLDRKSGHNEVRYSFWDGLKWAYHEDPIIYISENEIVPTPNSLVLDSDSYPVIAFARRSGTGFTLSLASYYKGWSFNELSVNYDVSWIGVVEHGGGLKFSSSSSSSSSSIVTTSSSESSKSSESLGNVSSSTSSLSSNSSSSSSSVDSSSSSSVDSSSSSSSSSYDDAVYFIVVYSGKTFRIYSVKDSGWTLLGSMVDDTVEVETLRIDICGKEVGIVFRNDDEWLSYNFFNVDSRSWAFTAFRSVGFVQFFGSVLDFSIKGFHEEDVGWITLAWASRSTNSFYLGCVKISDKGEELSFGLATPIIELSTISVTTSSTYLVNGYRAVGVSLDEYKDPRVFVTGSASKLFSFSSISNAWQSDLVEIDAPNSGLVVSGLQTEYSTDVKVSIASDSGDIYYFESDPALETFPVSTPDMMVLNESYPYHAEYKNGILQGVNVLGLFDNTCGAILKDTERPILITPDENSSSSSSSWGYSTSSSTSSISSLSSLSDSSTSFSTQSSESTASSFSSDSSYSESSPSSSGAP